MNSQKIEIPTNPTARDKGNGVGDLLAQAANESAAAVDDLAFTFAKSAEIDLVNNDAPVTVHGSPADFAEEATHVRRRR